MATDKLEVAWYIRVAFAVMLFALSGFIAVSGWKRIPRPSRVTALLGVLGVLLLGTALVMFNLMPDTRLISQIGAIGARLAYEVWIRAIVVVGTFRTGIVVLLSGVAALVFVHFRKRYRATSWISMPPVRLWVVSFTGALALCAVIDASLIARQNAAFKEHITRGYPDSFRGRIASGQDRQQERIGQPFELEFDDAITGRHVSMKDLRGKVVVVEFWATWCGPCVREIPQMKELYAKYQNQGVEFIGVSHDLPEEDGGLKLLKAFVAKEKITWPQYYLGRDEQRLRTGSPMDDFSESWGVDGIPTIFLIDANGNLYSTEARGQLENLLPKLLKMPPVAT